MISQLLYVGAAEVAQGTQYCDCGFIAEELIGRLQVLNVVNGMVTWLIDGSTVLLAVGLLAFAGVAQTARWAGSLVWLTRLVAIVGLATVAWSRVAQPLLVGTSVDLDYGTIQALLIGLTAGILVPIWALGTARAMRSTGANTPTID